MDGSCLSVHKIHKKFVPNCFLYLIMPKNSIFSPSASLHPLQGSTSHLITSSTHTQNFTYGFVLGPLQFKSTSQNIHLTSKTMILAMLVLKKDSTHLHSNQPKLRPVSESSTHPYKTMYVFSRSPPGQGVMPTNLLPVIAPRMEPSFTYSC